MDVQIKVQCFELWKTIQYDSDVADLHFVLRSAVFQNQQCSYSLNSKVVLEETKWRCRVGAFLMLVLSVSENLKCFKWSSIGSKVDVGPYLCMLTKKSWASEQLLKCRMYSSLMVEHVHSSETGGAPPMRICLRRRGCSSTWSRCLTPKFDASSRTWFLVYW